MQFTESKFFHVGAAHITHRHVEFLIELFVLIPEECYQTSEARMPRQVQKVSELVWGR